jgi:hypothetical protein
MPGIVAEAEGGLKQKGPGLPKTEKAGLWACLDEN